MTKLEEDAVVVGKSILAMRLVIAELVECWPKVLNGCAIGYCNFLASKRSYVKSAMLVDNT